MAVSARTSDDVWAVGYHNSGRQTSPTAAPLTDAPVDKTLVLHWDGMRWRTVSSPNAGNSSSRLTGVATVSASDAWAVGYSDGDAVVGAYDATPTTAIILRWDGKLWLRVNAPQAGKYRNELYGLSVLNKDAVWAIGRYTPSLPDPSMPHTGDGPDAQPLILRWDGSTWSQVPTVPAGNSFTGIAVAASDAAWAVGSISTEGSNEPVVMQWDGMLWSIADATVPDPVVKGAPRIDSLESVVAPSPGEAWAVGSYRSGRPGSETLILRRLPQTS